MRFLFWKAFLGLLTFDLLLLGRDFRRLHRIVSNWKVAPYSTSSATDRACEAINRACSWYPKRVLCLQRSAVTTCLLRSCGIPARMVLGAQKMPFKAHAWVEVGGCVFNDSAEVQTRYGVWERC